MAYLKGQGKAGSLLIGQGNYENPGITFRVSYIDLNNNVKTQDLLFNQDLMKIGLIIIKKDTGDIFESETALRQAHLL